jgi:hypothetical protein
MTSVALFGLAAISVWLVVNVGSLIVLLRLSANPNRTPERAISRFRSIRVSLRDFSFERQKSLVDQLAFDAG